MSACETFDRESMNVASDVWGADGREAAWLARARDSIECRLAEECEIMARELTSLAAVIESAIGTRGQAGGRWRPMLALVATEACGRPAEEALDAAIAVELTHTASLVLDDLPCMDDADERRGQPSTHRLVGSAGAILLSVGLLARSAELLGRQARCGGALARAWGETFGLGGMAGGQAIDVASTGRLRGAKRRLHRAKSSALPALALGAGAHIAGAPAPVRLGLEGYGRALGWAYQLLDDIEDAREDEALGRGSSASLHPASQSARIMRWSMRRLRALPGLEPDAREIMIALSRRVVPVLPPDGLAADGQTTCRQGRQGRQGRR